MLDDDDFYETMMQASNSFGLSDLELFENIENITPNLNASSASAYSAIDYFNFPTDHSPALTDLKPLSFSQPVADSAYEVWEGGRHQLIETEQDASEFQLDQTKSQPNDHQHSVEVVSQNANEPTEQPAELQTDLHLIKQPGEQHSEPNLNEQTADEEVESEPPFRRTSKDQLKDGDYLEILTEFDKGTSDDKLNHKQNVYRPSPGDLFVFKSTGEQEYEKFADGFCWHRDGGKPGESLDKRFFKVAYYPSEELHTKQVKDGRFKQRIFFLRNPSNSTVRYSIVHYTGQNDFVTNFGSHGNARSKKPFCTSRATEAIKQTIQTNPSNIKTLAEIKENNQDLPFKRVDDPRSLNQIAYRRQQAKLENKNFTYDWSAVNNLCFHGLDCFIRRIQLCKSVV